MPEFKSPSNHIKLGKHRIYNCLEDRTGRGGAPRGGGPAGAGVGRVGRGGGAVGVLRKEPGG